MTDRQRDLLRIVARVEHCDENPAASKLGVQRALYHSEDRGVPEKFRPYALPSDEWLTRLRGRLGGAAN